MSTIGTNSEDLILNADGSGSDIKFKSNGTEVASISDGGVVTATSFAGSGANLTGIADATKLPLTGGTLTGNLIVGDTSSNESFIKISDDDTSAYIGAEGSACCVGMSGSIASGDNLRIMADGRGLSQFTAKVWGILDGNTNNIKDSHNVSSITDHGAGDYTFNFTNNLGSSTFCTTSSFSRTHWDNFVSIYGGHQTAGSVRVTHNRTSTSGGIDTDQLCIQIFGD